MFELSRLRLQDMTACGAALRQLGEGAPSIEAAANRITRYLYTNLTTGPDEDPACVLVRAFKTHPYRRLSPELQALVDAQLGGKPDNHEMKCLTLLGSTGAVPGWNNPALSSRFRVIPLDGPDALAKLPMFSQLFAQFHIDLPFLENPTTSLLLDQYSSTFNAFHVPQALNSPYVPGQQEFIVPFGVQSVLGFGGLLQTGEMFAVVLFATVPIAGETAELVRSFALSAKLALAPFEHEHLIIPTPPSILTKESDSLSALRHRVDTLEAILTVQEQTVEAQSSRLDAALAASREQTKHIQAQRLQFETLAATSPIGIFQTDAAGRCLYTNASWQSITGLSSSDWLGDGWNRAVLEEDRARIFTAWEHATTQGQDFSLEFRMQRPDGTIRWVHSRARPMRNEAGSLIGHVGTTEDITERKQTEEALHKQREQLHAIVDGTSDAVFVKDLQGRYLLFNTAGGAFVGKTPDEVLGHDDTFIFPPEEATAVMERDRAVMAGAKTITYEDDVTTADGVRRIFLSTKGPLHDARGKVCGIFGISRDITERKQFEDDLRQSEARYRRYFELGLIGMAVTSLKKGWVQVNDRLCEIFGYSHDELVTKTWTELTHPDDVAPDMAQFNRVLAGEINGYTLDKRFIRKDGRIIYATISASAVRRTDGSIDHFVALVQDITDRKQAEDALRTSETRFRHLANTLPMLVWIADTTKACTWFNDGWLTFTGRTLEQEYGNGWAEGVHPDDFHRCLDVYATAFDRRESFEMEYRLRHHDGTYHWLIDRGAPQFNAAGVFAGYIGGCVDIQGQRETAERLRQTEERWTYAFEGSGDGVWDWNAVTNKVFFSNRWKSMLGYAPEEIGDSLEEWSSRVHPDDLHCTMADVQRHFSGETAVYTNEHRLRCKDGTYKWILDRGKVLQRASDGTPLRVVGTHTDITERKRSEEAQTRSRDRILSFVEHTPAPIAILDRNLRYVAVSHRWLEAYRLGEQNIIGKHHYDVFPEIRAMEEWQAIHQRCLAGAVEKQDEQRFVRADGSENWLRWEVRPWRNTDGHIGGIILYTEDITERKQAEDRFRQVVESMPHGMLIVNQAGIITLVNSQVERLFDYTRQELLGQPVELLIPERFRSQHSEMRAAYFASPASRPMGAGRDLHARRKDGSEVPVEIGLNPITTPAGIHVLASVVDITARQHADIAQRRLAAIVASSDDAIISKDLQGRITSWNHGAERIFGYTADDIIGQPGTVLMPPDRAGEETELIARLLRDERIEHFETRRRCQDGRIIDVSLSISPIKNHAGTIIGSAKLARDITTRTQSEQARLKLQQAIDHGRDGLALLDEHGRYTYMNPAYAAMYGYSQDELLGKSWRELYPAEWAAMIEHIYLPMLSTSGHWQGELVGQLKSGEAFDVDVALTLLIDPHTNVHTILSTCRDISSRKQMERELIDAKDAAEAGIRAKSEFLATMSHEIRTPMNGVLGMTDLLIDTTLTAEQREFVHTLKHSGESLMRIINDILDFSKIEAGKLTIETLPFDLRMTVEDTLDLLAPTAQAKHLELVGLIDAQAPNAVIGDPGRIRQILTNLIGNAIKFTESGEVLVQVLTAEESPASVLLRFEIVDTGVGLTEEAKAKLFQSFTQADSSTARKYGGTGLGLAICKRLTELMGGQIGIQSFPGTGTCVWFTIRLITQADAGPVIPPALIDNLNGLRICLVDDNATNRSLLQYHACDWKMHYESAEDGPSALALIRRAAMEGKPFDLAILDMHMPGMDGLALGRAIRDDATLDHTRLVLLTSLGRRGDAKLAIAAGFSGYLTKPVRKVQLYDCLRLVMGQTPATAEGDSTEQAEKTLITRHQVEELHAQVKLLVVDDNLINQKVAVKMLEKLGYRVDVAGNGNEALAALTRHHYNLVFMDCQMPELDGFETTRMIRAHELPGTHLPIIAMTANAMEGDREHCLSSGMDDFVSKPVKSQDLKNVLTQWLDQSDRRAAA